MLKPAIIAAIALACTIATAEASPRHKMAAGLDPQCNDITMPCVPPDASTPRQARVTRGRYVARQLGFGAAIETRDGSSGETCTASQYGVGDGYHGRRTASGAIFNTYATNPYTVAALPPRRLGSFVTITNLANGLSIRAEVTDRGPYYHGRCVDLGRAGADAIGMGGTARVSVQ